VCAANSQLDTPLVWASLIVLSALGMALYGPVVRRRPRMPGGPEAEEKH
jgi:hypothetical protein